MSESRDHKLAAVIVGLVVLFMVGCTPGSGGSSSSSSSTSTGSQLASNPTPGGTNDPVSDPSGDPGNGVVGAEPVDPPGDGPSASAPEPATGLLFLCAAGSVALARLRARRRA